MILDKFQKNGFRYSFLSKKTGMSFCSNGKAAFIFEKKDDGFVFKADELNTVMIRNVMSQIFEELRSKINAVSDN